MFKRRRENGFNLAFLDVMACGLGAVLLILIIVNFNDDTPIPSDQIERLEQELAALKTLSQTLSNNLTEQSQLADETTKQAEQKNTEIAQLELQKQQLNQEIDEKKAIIAELEDAIAAVAPETANDPIQLPDVKEETYLLGLIVEGRNIGILLDSSASMTDESLINIIKRKFTSDTTKQSGPKWQRAVAISNWLLARVPDTSKVSVVTFNDSAKVLGNRKVYNANVPSNLEKLSEHIGSLVPKNGTNLQLGLEEIAQAMPNMTDLYIVTDGLPSLIEPSSGFSPSRRCNPFKGKQATITGECRVDVLKRTLAVNRLAGVRTNIVLLPLEGDPQASPLYWQWASYTGGTFISPAGTWP